MPVELAVGAVEETAKPGSLAEGDGEEVPPRVKVVVNVVTSDVVAWPSRFSKTRVEVTMLSTTEGKLAPSPHRSRYGSKYGPSASVQAWSSQQSWQFVQNPWNNDELSHISVELVNCASR